MSSSAISAAKKRTETALKCFNIPTTTEPNDDSEISSRNQVLLSLLQSRLNWSSNVFIKYRPDNKQQPKKIATLRKRYPMMQYLGQCTLELGPHLFPDTSLYQAIRSDSWIDLGKSVGLTDIENMTTVAANNNSDLTTTTTTTINNDRNTDAHNNNNDSAIKLKTITDITDINNDKDDDSAKKLETITDITDITVITDITDINNDKDDDSTKKLETITDVNSENQSKNDIVTDVKTTTIEINENTSTQSTVNNATTSTNNNNDDNTNTNTNTNTDTEINSSQQSEPSVQNSNMDQTTSLAKEKPHQHLLIYNDIVMEFKEFPGERYLFPREAILEVIPSEKSSSIKASFLLPLDPESADQFFWDTKKKIKHFGEFTSIPIIKETAKKYQTETSEENNNKDDASKKQKQYQPVNIRISDTNHEIITALNASVYNSDYVRSKMIEKLKKSTIPTRKYIDYKISEKDQEAINELIQRVHTVPDIISGPIGAEKKRNEIGLAIKLGKRPASDQHEAEPPKTKQNLMNKEDGFKKCLYCSTKHTIKWQRGPAGGGTLCNGCGILWQQGKILIGAPIISKEEEKQKIKKKWERDYYQRQQLEWEMERKRIQEEKYVAQRIEYEANARLEACLRNKKVLAERKNFIYNQQQQQQQKNHSQNNNNNNKNNNNNNNVQYPSQLQPSSIPNQQHHPQNINPVNGQSMPVNVNTNNNNNNANVSLDQNTQTSQNTDKVSNKRSTNTSTKENNSSKSTTTNNISNNNNTVPPSSTLTQASSSSSSSNSSYHIFNLPLIPLPTLCIEFSDTLFSHPHCTASISQQKNFTINLSKDDTNMIIHIPREALISTTFEVLGQIDNAGRDILLMTCQPNDVGFGIGKPLEAFGSVLYDQQDESKKQFKIRFLEKIDSVGGPVVKKILECWLAGTSNLN